MIKIKAKNAGNSSGRLLRNIRKFFKATAPALAPYPRPAGNAEIDYLTLK